VKLRELAKLIVLALFWAALLVGYELRERERRRRGWDAAVLYWAFKASRLALPS
jgi:hypothetical protein